MSNMPVVDVHVMVLMCYLSIFLVLCYRNMRMVSSFQRISGIGRVCPWLEVEIRMIVWVVQTL